MHGSLLTLNFDIESFVALSILNACVLDSTDGPFPSSYKALLEPCPQIHLSIFLTQEKWLL